MAKQLTLNGLKELRSYLNNVDLKKSVFILFTGNKTESNGSSWCPDCNDADPIIHKNVNLLSENSEFITCFVGDRPTWKDPQNEFRLDKEFQLKCVPTLVFWKKKKELKEAQCADEGLVQMLFEGN